VKNAGRAAARCWHASAQSKKNQLLDAIWICSIWPQNEKAPACTGAILSALGLTGVFLYN
jgi:hypothetical protein